ncbi:MAG TPA: acetyltransferase, partial [Mycobacterium sp.]|nr:acetyltransferase [Mycobacterium sp.]
CGQLATAAAAAPGEQRQSQPPIGPGCLGYVFYAPPRAVPRARRFPTGPVSADAVLLTSMGIEPGYESGGLAQRLVGQVVEDLVRRGVRALEAFGRTAAATELTDFSAADTSIRAVLEAAGDCSFERCIIDAEFLQDAGFVVVAPHRYFPRLRLELDRGLGWKADVEAALERLLEDTELPQPVGVGAIATSGAAVAKSR